MYYKLLIFYDCISFPNSSLNFGKNFNIFMPEIPIIKHDISLIGDEIKLLVTLGDYNLSIVIKFQGYGEYILTLTCLKYVV